MLYDKYQHNHDMGFRKTLNAPAIIHFLRNKMIISESSSNKYGSSMSFSGLSGDYLSTLEQLAKVSQIDPATVDHQIVYKFSSFLNRPNARVNLELTHMFISMVKLSTVPVGIYPIPVNEL